MWLIILERGGRLLCCPPNERRLRFAIATFVRNKPKRTRSRYIGQTPIDQIGIKKPEIDMEDVWLFSVEDDPYFSVSFFLSFHSFGRENVGHLWYCV